MQKPVKCITVGYDISSRTYGDLRLSLTSPPGAAAGWIASSLRHDVINPQLRLGLGTRLRMFIGRRIPGSIMHDVQFGKGGAGREGGGGGGGGRLMGLR